MKHMRLLSCAYSICLPFTRAAPAVSSTLRTASIASACINTEIRDNWFIGDCLTGEDSTTRIKSAVHLPNKIANDNGDLIWEANGNYRLSCSECKIKGGVTLTCQCNPAWQRDREGVQIGFINLEEHISVYNGHLLSNLSGLPTPPTENSRYPIPSDFRVRFGGNTTCPEADGPRNPDYCATHIYGCQGTSANDRNNTAWEFDGPVNCYVPIIWFPQYHYSFQVLRVVGEGAWIVEGFTDEQCSGRPAEKVSRDGVKEEGRMGKCNVMGERIRALRIRPGFNGDPN